MRKTVNSYDNNASYPVEIKLCLQLQMKFFAAIPYQQCCLGMLFPFFVCLYMCVLSFIHVFLLAVSSIFVAEEKINLVWCIAYVQ